MILLKQVIIKQLLQIILICPNNLVLRVFWFIFRS